MCWASRLWFQEVKNATFAASFQTSSEIFISGKKCSFESGKFPELPGRKSQWDNWQGLIAKLTNHRNNALKLYSNFPSEAEFRHEGSHIKAG